MTDDQQPTKSDKTAAAKAVKEEVAGDAALADHAARSHGNPSVVHDEGSELVDPDPAFEGDPEIEEEVFVAPHYAFAGGNLGGQGMFLCSICSSLVQESRQDSHTAWHRNGVS